MPKFLLVPLHCPVFAPKSNTQPQGRQVVLTEIQPSFEIRLHLFLIKAG